MATHSTPPPPNEPLLSVSDIRRRYPGLSQRTARRFMREIGAIEIGRTLFVRVEDLLALEAARLAGAGADSPPRSQQVRPRGYWLGEAA